MKNENLSKQKRKLERDKVSKIYNHKFADKDYILRKHDLTKVLQQIFSTE